MKKRISARTVALSTNILDTDATSARSHGLRQGHRELPLEDISWRDAVRDFIRHSLSTKEKKTQTYYRLNLERLAFWAECEDVTLHEFRLRHLREYIAVPVGSTPVPNILVDA